MKNIAILLFISFSFVFTACADKQVIFKDRLVCNKQLTVPRVEADIRIHKDDLEVARAYKESKDSAFGFYEKQVETNNKTCDELANEVAEEFVKEWNEYKKGGVDND